MEQVNALAGMLGMSGNAPRREPLPQKETAAGSNPPWRPWETWGPWEACSGNNPPAAAPALDNDMAQTMMKILPLLGSIQQEDDNTRLLRALRPPAQRRAAA